MGFQRRTRLSSCLESPIGDQETARFYAAWDRFLCCVDWGHEELQAVAVISYGLGLEISPGVGDEVSRPGACRGRRAAVPRAAEGVCGAGQGILGPAPVGLRVASSGNVSDALWAEYIKNRTPPEPYDNFNVV